MSAHADEARLMSPAAYLRVLQLSCLSKDSHVVPLLLFHPSTSLLFCHLRCLDTEGLQSSSPQHALLVLLAAPLWGWCHIVISSKIHCNSLYFLASADVNVSLPESGNILILPGLRLVSTLLLTF